jgi:hypothetical protein
VVLAWVEEAASLAGGLSSAMLDFEVGIRMVCFPGERAVGLDQDLGRESNVCSSAQLPTFSSNLCF